jgi:hypothetical protein
VLQERGVFAIEKQEEPDKDPTTAPNAAPVLPGENARENNTDSVQVDELVVLSTIVDTPIDSLDPNIDLKKSEEDNCVIIGKEILVGFYLDDFFVIARPRSKIEALKRDLTARYEEIKATFGANLTFLGMNFEFIETQVNVSIPLEGILKDITGIKPTPAGMNLFAIDESAEPLSEHSSKEFHSMVAKLLYVAKRTRGDILLPVNFLATRVKSPTKDDLIKLNRVLQYLNGTPDQAMTLSMNTMNDLTLHAYVDASYAVHADLKSHSGVMFSIGTGSIYVSSTKQSCVSKSSTEAELIAFTDYIGEAMSTRNILEDITRMPVKLIVHQDNQAVLAIIKNGVLGGKSKTASKHVKVRVAWIKERIDAGDFEAGYCPGNEMKSDGLTKPKSTEDHMVFRNNLGMFSRDIPKERAVRFGTVM